MPLRAGALLGPYEIVAPLGAGGMGEVYRATDTNLKRQVAIKVLPASVAGDAERLARFQREAEVLAALNHPNIAHIHGLEKSDGTVALVMELVEGPTLADRLANGAIPIDEALPIARQIAEALEAAHEQGIIHRDLKPANIKVRSDGTAKILDFGLAKALEPTGAMAASGSLSPTITTPAMTQAGMILGTAAYMSPEQARGRAVDKRTDVWAFGCVLFEMVTGRRAFDGEDVSDTLANVLKREPDWTALPRDRSGLRRLLRRCLEKDRKRRLADIADAWFDLDEEPHITAESAPVRSPMFRLSIIGPVLIGLAIVAGALMYASLARHTTDGQLMRFPVVLPDGWSVAAGVNPNGAAYGPLAVSPDGRLIAILARNSDGHVRLWLRQLDALTARELPGTDDAAGPFWSPDSRFLGFFADGKLKKMDISGGPPVTLCETATFNAASWSKDGVIVFARAGVTGGPLLKVSAAGGVSSPATTLAKDESFHLRPAFLPDGRHFFYRAAGASLNSLYLASLDSPDRTVVFEHPDASNVVYTNDHLLFLREQTLMAQPFDTKRLTFSGEPVPIVDQVQTSANVALFSASTTGVLAYVTAGAEAPSRLTWFDASGKRLSGGIDSAGYGDVELSPDGQHASMSVRGTASGAGRDIWLLDLVRGVPSRFTFDPANELESVWSPDGTRIVFNRGRNGRLDLFEKAASGEGTERLLFTDDVDKHPTSWSPDGKLLLYTAGGQGDLWVLPMSGGKPLPFIQTPANEREGQFSPDGRWVAYTSNESGFPQVYLTSFPGPGGKRQVSTMRASQPRWRSDGRELYYVSADNAVIAVTVDMHGSAVATGPERRRFTFAPAAPRSTYAVAPDGRFLVNTTTVDTAQRPLPITVIVNWPSGLPH